MASSVIYTKGCSLDTLAVPSSHPQYTLSPKVVAEEGAEANADDKAQYTDDSPLGLDIGT